jgi:hypothetical protein
MKKLFKFNNNCIKKYSKEFKNLEIKKNQERNLIFENITKNLPSFESILMKNKINELKRNKTTIFQVNIGKLCNLACHHCHVESVILFFIKKIYKGPTKKRENMYLFNLIQ